MVRGLHSIKYFLDRHNIMKVAALVRVKENPQQLTVQWTDGESRNYLSTDRDSLLASLLDGAR